MYYKCVDVPEIRIQQSLLLLSFDSLLQKAGMGRDPVGETPMAGCLLRPAACALLLLLAPLNQRAGQPSQALLSSRAISLSHPAACPTAFLFSLPHAASSAAAMAACPQMRLIVDHRDRSGSRSSSHNNYALDLFASGLYGFRIALKESATALARTLMPCGE